MIALQSVLLVNKVTHCLFTFSTFQRSNVFLFLCSVNLQGCQVHLPIFPMIEVDEMSQFNTHEKVTTIMLLFGVFVTITCYSASTIVLVLVVPVRKGSGLGGAPECL